MSYLDKYKSAAEWYTAILKNSRKSKLPPDYPQPQPPEMWPAENVSLLERYLLWLHADNAGPSSIHHYYLPTAGHVLGYHLEHHSKLDISAGSMQALEAGLKRVMDYFQAKQLSDRWLIMGQHALHRFRRFLHQERGYAQLPPALNPQPNLGAYQVGLPDWLISQLRQYQQIRQANWRPSRLHRAIINFWRCHSQLWRWLFAQGEITGLSHITRQHIFTFIDERLAKNYNVSSINLEVRAFQATLRFLQERDYEIPQALLRRFSLREPDTLPRFLTDEQVGKLQTEIEQCVPEASTPARQRNALLDRAIFYLLWQGGLRASEVEDLQLTDLNTSASSAQALSQQQLIIRGGKGQKDRTIYLTESACTALTAYLTQRGSSDYNHVFLYRHRPLSKDLARNRIKAAGKRAGVKVTPHQLRHTYGTQLVNAGCPITTIQALMGHKRLSTTLVYTQIHNRTVADDYYAAMDKVEKGLAEQLQPPPTATEVNGNSTTANTNTTITRLLTLAEALQTDKLPESQQTLLLALQDGLSSLVDTTTSADLLHTVVNEPIQQLQRQYALP